MFPLVSIIMPVHNCEEYITESINSIINQTYKNLELIIVDTGSKDRTNDLINKINDSRIKVIKTSPGKGLTHAFSEGLKASSGAFITRHDPDDVSSPNRIKEQVEYLLSRNDLGMVSCLIRCVTNTEKHRRACLFIERLQNAYKGSDAIEEAILSNFIPIIFPTLLIRRTIIDMIDISEEAEGFDDQVELLIDLMKKSTVEKINKVLYTYRRHDKAYHLVNEKEYYNYTNMILDKSDIKNYILYRDFYTKTPKRIPYLNNKSSIRVLMLVDALNLGGTETHVLDLTKKLMEMGTYVVVGTSGGPLTNIFENNGIKVYKVPLNSDYISNKLLYSDIKLIKDIIDKERINLLHCHLFASMGIGSEIHKRYKISNVTTIHGLFYPNDVLLGTYFNTNAIIAVSEPTRKLIYSRLGREVEDRLFVIPNGVSIIDNTENTGKVDIRKELSIAEKDTIVTYCSRLAWSKTSAAENFIFSFFKLAHDNDNVHAIVIGDGDGRDILQRETNMLNSSLGRTVIHMVGAKYNVNDYYLSSDIVVGTGRVALEAMSCGKPVIAVGNNGYVGIVSPESSEIQWEKYFGDHDSIKKPDLISIYEDMKYLFENTDRRIELGNWCKQWCANKFNIDKVAEDTLDVYKKVLYKN
jgi:glycosyltransferase involved in cell wall biosynthesis